MIFDICRFIEKFLDDKSKAYNIQSPIIESGLKRKFSPVGDIKRRKLSSDLENSKSYFAKNQMDKEKLKAFVEK